MNTNNYIMLPTLKLKEPKCMDYEESLIIKTAWYYYLENMTQQRISDLLGISRMRVIKLLEKARTTGVIQFKIREDSKSKMLLEKSLQEKYALKDTFVVPTNPDEENINETVARACAMYISDRITKDDVINIGYGDTPSRILNNLATMTEYPLSYVSLTGGVNYYLPNTLSSVFNAKLYLIPAPLLMSSKQLAQTIYEEASVKEVHRMLNLSKISVVGIGGMNEDATIVKSGVLNKNDLLYLQMQGAVGDVLSHFIDKDGNSVNTDFEDRLISISLDKLKELKNVIGVAAGKSKLNAIKATLKGKYIDILVTDENTAIKLLEGPEETN